MTTNQAGKGDRPRPVNREKYDRNFDLINFPSRPVRHIDAEQLDPVEGAWRDQREEKMHPDS